MRASKQLTLCLSAMLSAGLPAAVAQTSAPVVQNATRVLGNGSAHARVTQSSAPAAYTPVRPPGGLAPQTIRAPQAMMNVPASANVRPNYLPFTRPTNPALAAMNARQTARTYNLQPTTNLLAKNELAPDRLPFVNNRTGTRDYSAQPTAEMLARRQPPSGSAATTPKALEVPTRGAMSHVAPDALAPRDALQSGERHNWKSNSEHFRKNFSDALRCHWHEWHDRDWWRRHCTTIVFVSGGYYFLDAGYWYPAWGYDQLNSYYDYDGPIYTYGNLLPDEVIANVQLALQDAGYYFGAINGSLSVETRAALVNFQRDYGLPITGAIDQPTIETLGLY